MEKLIRLLSRKLHCLLHFHNSNTIVIAQISQTYQRMRTFQSRQTQFISFRVQWKGFPTIRNELKKNIAAPYNYRIWPFDKNTTFSRREWEREHTIISDRISWPVSLTELDWFGANMQQIGMQMRWVVYTGFALGRNYSMCGNDTVLWINKHLNKWNYFKSTSVLCTSLRLHSVHHLPIPFSMPLSLFAVHFVQAN